MRLPRHLSAKLVGEFFFVTATSLKLDAQALGLILVHSLRLDWKLHYCLSHDAESADFS
jgi:hypothetical protein